MTDKSELAESPSTDAFKIFEFPRGVLDTITAYLPLHDVVKLAKVNRASRAETNELISSIDYCLHLIHHGRFKDVVSIASNVQSVAESILQDSALASKFSIYDLLSIIESHAPLAVEFFKQHHDKLSDAQVLSFCRRQPEVVDYVASFENGLNSFFLMDPNIFLNRYPDDWEGRIDLRLLQQVNGDILKQHIHTKEQLLYCFNHFHRIFDPPELYDLIDAVGLTKQDTFNEDIPSYAIPTDPNHLCLVAILDPETKTEVLHQKGLFDLLTDHLKEFVCLKDEHTATLALHNHNRRLINLGARLRHRIIQAYPSLTVLKEDYAHLCFDGMLWAHNLLEQHTMLYESIAVRFARKYVADLNYNTQHMSLIIALAKKYPEVRKILLSAHKHNQELNANRLAEVTFTMAEITSLMKKWIAPPLGFTPFVKLCLRSDETYWNYVYKALKILLPNENAIKDILIRQATDRQNLWHYIFNKMPTKGLWVFMHIIPKIMKLYPNLLNKVEKKNKPLFGEICRHWAVPFLIDYANEIKVNLKPLIKWVRVNPLGLRDHNSQTIVDLAKIHLELFEMIISSNVLVSMLSDQQLSQICTQDGTRLKFFLESDCKRQIQLDANTLDTEMAHFYYAQMPNPKLKDKIGIPPNSDLQRIPMAVIKMRDPDMAHPKHIVINPLFDGIVKHFEICDLEKSVAALKI